MFLYSTNTDASSHDPLFTTDPGISNQLCQDTDIYDLNVIPIFGSH